MVGFVRGERLALESIRNVIPLSSLGRKCLQIKPGVSLTDELGLGYSASCTATGARSKSVAASSDCGCIVARAAMKRSGMISRRVL